MKIGYLGPKGTFSYAALMQLNRGPLPYEGVEIGSIGGLFEAYTAHEVDAILVPIENSLEGPVTGSMDALVSQSRGSIVSELELPVSHALMGFGPDIHTIHSHTQPLGQCRLSIQSRYPHAELVSSLSTAQAAQDVLFLGEGHAVLGHEVLSALYHLQVLDRNLQDGDDNTTRFFVLSEAQTAPTGKDTTSIVFSTPQDVPGSLCDVLSIFSAYGINLSKINSRPAKTHLGDYLFFIDCDGHYLDAVLNSVLDQVQDKTSFYKWLGSYPKGVRYA